jgi:ankyrin repeat protein
MESQSFCDDNQINVLRQVFTITALQGFKEEVFPFRYACSAFYNDEALFNALANYQITGITSLLAYAIYCAIKSNDNIRAIKLINRITPWISDEIEMMNPNKTYFTFMRYVSVYMKVIRNENIEILERMLIFPITEKKKYALFFFSIEEKSISVIKYFMSKGYNLNYQLMQPFSTNLPNIKLEKTSLMMGVQTKNLEIVKLLVENGAVSTISPVEIKNNNREYTSMSPILISCLSKDWNIFNYLLDNSNIVHQNEIIISLCNQDNINQLKKFIDRISKNNEGEQLNPIVIPDEAYIQASKKINVEIFNYLFDNFEINNLQTRNRIIIAMCNANNYDILDKVLIKYPGEINYNEFNYACKYSSEEIIVCLINHGADINFSNLLDTTLLTKIAERNFIGVAQMLLDRKIDINHQSNRGWTALMSAVTNGHIEMVKFLMENGADKTLKNDMRRDVLEMAEYKNCVEIIKILNNNF